MSSHQEQVILVLLVALLVAGTGWLAYRQLAARVLPLPVGPAPPDPVPVPSPAPAPAPLYVHVAGAVHHPGLYQLLPGARVFHAVEAAGGTTPEAHPDAVNLAAPLSDGQRVYIPTRAETAEPDHTWSAKVNINRADQARLESLPGIGPALALEIISYRNRQGPFKSIEELTNISGIGQRTLERLRPLVTID